MAGYRSAGRPMSPWYSSVPCNSKSFAVTCSSGTVRPSWPFTRSTPPRHRLARPVAAGSDQRIWNRGRHTEWSAARSRQIPAICFHVRAESRGSCGSGPRTAATVGCGPSVIDRWGLDLVDPRLLLRPAPDAWMQRPKLTVPGPPPETSPDPADSRLNARRRRQLGRRVPSLTFPFRSAQRSVHVHFSAAWHARRTSGSLAAPNTSTTNGTAPRKGAEDDFDAALPRLSCSRTPGRPGRPSPGRRVRGLLRLRLRS